MSVMQYGGSDERWLALFIVAVLSLSLPLTAHAVPAYARQTGQNCVACHAGGQFPELTPYGRMFKLTGYTIGTRNIPLSAMAVVSYTKTRNTSDVGGLVDVPDTYRKDGNLVFQTGSVFLAGKITNNLGLFSQITYDNYASRNPDTGKFQGHSGADNIDLRYADRFISPGNDLIIGASVNNNPSVQDVFNSAPAWVYPYLSSGFAQGTSSPTPLLEGGLGQLAAGYGVYAYWNKLVYAELSAYQTANGIWSLLSQGTHNADQTKLKGLNPYWRIALTRDWGPHSAMIGTTGMVANVYPNNEDPSGPTVRFRDIGVDAQYQYILDPHTVTAQLSYIKEKISANDLLGAANSSNTVDSFKLKATYVYQAKYGGSLGYFRTGGSSDASYQTTPDPADPAAVPLGAASATPGAAGWIPEIFWTPTQYVRVGMQYTMYDKFNGGSNNYDGFGRNAKDNNTLYFYVWGAY